MQPKIYFVDEHEIDSHLIDSDALYVLKKLHDAGHKAYLVGGSVRDLLLKRKPKDYDISTSALPEQVKQIFGRSCILIGRRFRLAHIRFGKKILEVATFRSGENDGDLILQDNSWGTAEEDVLRRDFTINGLFYDPANHSVIDYVGGWSDIHKRMLKTIGTPDIRFRQDPVRMIRLLKFRARFDFDIDQHAMEALELCRGDLIKSSPARVLEEMFRMLESGAAAPFFQLLSKHGLMELLFPSLAEVLKEKTGKQIYAFLQQADRINQNFGPAALERPVITSCILYPLVEKELREQYIQKNETPHMGQIMMVTSGLTKNNLVSAFSHFPRRISSIMNFIITTQYRLTPFSGKRNYRLRLFKHKEFVMAMKFLKIRSMVDPTLAEAYSSWKKVYYQHERHGDRRPHPHHPTVKKGHQEHQESRQPERVGNI